MALDHKDVPWTSGRSGNKGRAHTKGRPLDEQAWAEVRDLLGTAPAAATC